MKILITTDLFTTATNGVVTSVRNLHDELKKDGHDVRILTLSGTGRSCRKGNATTKANKKQVWCKIWLYS